MKEKRINLVTTQENFDKWKEKSNGNLTAYIENTLNNDINFDKKLIDFGNYLLKKNGVKNGLVSLDDFIGFQELDRK